jgi:hypothetical protein
MAVLQTHKSDIQLGAEDKLSTASKYSHDRFDGVVNNIPKTSLTESKNITISG